MTWSIQFEKKAKKEFYNLDKKIQNEILCFFEKKFKVYDNPRSFGKSLTGTLSGYWRYRVGDYRIVCDIKDKILTIMVVKVAHRRNAYK